MNNIKFINILIILFATNFILEPNFSNKLNEEVDSDKYITSSYLNFSDKAYYESIFKKDERKQLSKSDKYLKKAKKYIQKYESYQSEIDRLYKIAGATSSAKSKKKALKKAKKLENKALKNGDKALEYYNNANSIRSKIYSTAINRNRLDDKSKNAILGRALELQAKALLQEAEKIEKTAPIHDKKLKFQAYIKANDKKIKAFKLQEDAFGFYAKDNTLNADSYVIDSLDKDTNNNEKTDTTLFPVYVEQYNPLRDSNLYKSKANFIIPKLNLSSQELSLFVESNRKNEYANNLLRQVDEAYFVIDSLNIVAEMVKDEMEKDRIKQKARTKEANAFYKLIKATNTYIEVNKIRYNIYIKNINKVKKANNNNKDIQKADFYVKEANDYFLKANYKIKQTKKMIYKSDQYINLMSANDLQLYSLQLIESAYGLYMDMPNIVTENIESLHIDDNTPIEKTKGLDTKTASKSLSWELLSTYTYSKNTPMPVKYQYKKGIVFCVQVGIFKGYLPPHIFNTISPVIFDKFVKNPYRRYLVGEYFTFEAAELALQKVKIIGYSDAYIIAKQNGIRKKYYNGKSQLIFDNNYNYMKNKELSKLNGVSYSNNNSSNSNSNSSSISVNTKQTGSVTGKNIKNTTGLVYLVQLVMYKNPIPYSKVKYLQPIYTEIIPNKGTKYMIGTFSTISEARTQNSNIKAKGINDSYVIAYYNGVNISLDKAKQLEKPNNSSYNNNNINYSKNSITFKVQVGAYSNKLSNNEEQKLKAKFLAWTVNKQFAKGMYIYTIGNYKTYNPAKQMKKELLAEGKDGVFVIAFNGSKKIKVGEAIKLSGK